MVKLSLPILEMVRSQRSQQYGGDTWRPITILYETGQGFKSRTYGPSWWRTQKDKNLPIEEQIIAGPWPQETEDGYNATIGDLIKLALRNHKDALLGEGVVYGGRASRNFHLEKEEDEGRALDPQQLVRTLWLGEAADAPRNLVLHGWGGQDDDWTDGWETSVGSLSDAPTEASMDWMATQDSPDTPDNEGAGAPKRRRKRRKRRRKRDKTQKRKRNKKRKRRSTRKGQRRRTARRAYQGRPARLHSRRRYRKRIRRPRSRPTRGRRGRVQNRRRRSRARRAGGGGNKKRLRRTASASTLYWLDPEKERQRKLKEAEGIANLPARRRQYALRQGPFADLPPIDGEQPLKSCNELPELRMALVQGPGGDTRDALKELRENGSQCTCGDVKCDPDKPFCVREYKYKKFDTGYKGMTLGWACKKKPPKRVSARTRSGRDVPPLPPGHPAAAPRQPTPQPRRRWLPWRR